MSFVYKDFKIEDIKLKQLFVNTEKFSNVLLNSQKIIDVLGSNPKFPDLPTTRPYFLASFVCSVDGKILYPDNSNGNLIAQNNFLDKNGGLADFWIMNMLRSFSDGFVVGGKTLQDNPKLSANIYDKDLISDCKKQGKTTLPSIIIPTLNAKSIPYNHNIFNGSFSVIIITTQKSAQIVYNGLKHGLNNVSIINIDDYDKENISKLKIKEGEVVILSSNFYNNKINSQGIFNFLKKHYDFNVISIESASFFHNMIEDKLVDEIFLNYSGVYVGGDALSIGKNAKSFDSINHPHLELLELYLHANNFLYTRQKIIYEA
jgi:riboflavin biosynthesis pyrimidine reductase